MTLFDHLLVFAFAVLYPAVDLYSSSVFKTRILANIPGTRIRAYQNSITWIWALSLLVVVYWAYLGRLSAGIGLDYSACWQALVGIIVLISGVSYMRYIYKAIGSDFEQQKALKEKVGGIQASVFLPRTKRDYMWFVLVSISAGICEELLFRGYLMWYINQVASTASAIVISAILFGLAHSYQGRKGVIQSGISGVVLAIVYVLTNSLWIPIALHIIGDAYSGMLGWLAFDETNQKRQES